MASAANPEAVASQPSAAPDNFLLRRFEACASSRPVATAVRCGSESLTYAELNRHANRLANELLTGSAGRPQVVGLCLPPSIELVVSMLAVMKAGCAYVALDPDYPVARLQAIIGQANPQTVLVGEVLSGELHTCFAAAEVRTVRRQSDDVLDAAAAVPNPQVNIEADDLCYVMFTSGSAGEPKGVMVSHGNLSMLFETVQNSLALTASDNWSALHSCGFGFSVWEIWGALSTGGALTIIEQQQRADPGAWCATATEANVSVLSLTPSGLRQLLMTDCLAADGCLAALRLVVLSGEAVHAEDIAAWQSTGPGRAARLVNTYALTETSGRVTVKEYHEGQALAPGAIGMPTEDALVRVVDPATLQSVPAGEAGELLLGGPMVALGYLGDPELTAERFVLLEQADGSSSRFYRSGDLARESADGELAFVGRLDTQIKLRGHRIELGDIESALRQHPEVHDAAVVLSANAGSQQLAAFVVPVSHPPESESGEVEFWPSLGEYQVYDELLYDFMSADEVRVASYRRAFERHVPGKVVLDIGTGKDAVLARMCVAAGARKVYAVEVLPDAAAQAQQLVNELGLGERIQVICADMRQLTLPDDIDVCTQGIVGNIGSSDGIASIWNSARHLFAERHIAVPERCTTMFAPAQLPERARSAPAFGALAGRYTEAIFAKTGRQFDVRLCVRNFPAAGLLAEAAVFEELDFRAQLATDHRGSVTFSVKSAGLFDGFLVWTRILTDADTDNVVDFFEHQQAWLPVWLPVCDEPVEVEAGASIQVEWQCVTPADDIFPDYTVVACVQQGDAPPLELSYTTRHHESACNSTELHRRLLSKLAATPQPAASATDYADWLSNRLPDYMIPGSFSLLEQLPLNVNGKLDRQALAEQGDAAVAPVNLPADEFERAIAAIWCAVLERDSIDTHVDFFAAGGDSILAVRLTTEVQRYLDDTVFLAALFDAPTVHSYSAWLLEHHAAAVARCSAGSPAGDAAPEPALPASQALSSAQQSLWFLQQLYPDSTAANEQFVIRLTGKLNLSRLASAWQSLFQRHDVLRTRITGTAEAPVQLSVAVEELKGSTELPVVSLTDLEPEAAELRLAADAAIELAAPFKLNQAPLLRGVLYLLPGDGAALLATAHHIIADGLCVPLIRDELAAAYTDPLTPPPKLQFADFVARQEAVMTPDWQAGELEWWREQLAGHSVQPIKVAAVRGTGAGREVRIPFSLDSQAADALRALARSEGATLFMLLLAAWRSWLTRCMQADDLLIGSPATLRRDADTSGMLGCMVNNVVYRNPVAKENSFRAVLSAERERALAVYDHSVVPFERIVDALAPEREYGRHPLFQIMFMFEDRSDPIVMAGEVEFRTDVPIVDRASYWDLELSVADHGSGAALTGFIGLRDDVFDADALAWWPAGLTAMLHAVVENPDRPISALPLHSAAQLHRQLHAWNATDMEIPGEGLHALFAGQADRTPDRIAIVDATETLTYGELLERADVYAAILMQRGVQQGSIVGIAIEQSADAIGWLLAILRCGGTWLPLDPGYPTDRLLAMQADAEPALVIVAQAGSARLNNAVSTDELRAGAVGAAAVSHPLPSVQSGDPAWLLYTSGSTGAPKGTIGTHAAAVSRILWMWQRFGFKSDAVFAQRTSLNFIDSVWEIFGPLLHGARVAIPPANMELDAPAFLAWLGERRVTHLVTVPSLLRALLDAHEVSPQTLQLSSMISSGEALRSELAVRLRQQMPDCRLLNTYGTTETWDATCFDTEGVALTSETVSVGKPVANARIYVLDSDGQLLPPGAPGELCVAGPGVNAGYLHRPELTQERFATAAWDEAVRLFHTGDLACMSGDGNVQLLGRMDRQLKLRGLRIEAADIEVHALAHPDVRQCALALREDAAGAEWLALFVVCDNGISIDGDTLRSLLQDRLPRAMVPADIVQLASLPLLPNGKLDSAALPAGDSPPGVAAEYIAPRNSAEERVAVIWASALGLQRVGVHDDFFALRGHSLLATKVIARICDEFAIDIPLQCLFESPTVAGLAEQIAALNWALQGESPMPGGNREIVRL